MYKFAFFILLTGFCFSSCKPRTASGLAGSTGKTASQETFYFEASKAAERWVCAATCTGNEVGETRTVECGQPYGMPLYNFIRMPATNSKWQQSDQAAFSTLSDWILEPNQSSSIKSNEVALVASSNRMISDLNQQLFQQKCPSPITENTLQSTPSMSQVSTGVDTGAAKAKPRDLSVLNDDPQSPFASVLEKKTEQYPEDRSVLSDNKNSPFVSVVENIGALRAYTLKSPNENRGVRVANK